MSNIIVEQQSKRFTHFLRIPLLTITSKPQLEASLRDLGEYILTGISAPKSLNLRDEESLPAVIPKLYLCRIITVTEQGASSNQSSRRNCHSRKREVAFLMDLWQLRYWGAADSANRWRAVSFSRSTKAKYGRALFSQRSRAVVGQEKMVFTDEVVKAR